MFVKVSFDRAWKDSNVCDVKGKRQVLAVTKTKQNQCAKKEWETGERVGKVIENPAKRIHKLACHLPKTSFLRDFRITLHLFVTFLLLLLQLFLLLIK